MAELEKQQAQTIELQRKQIELQGEQIELLREENRLLKEKVDYVLRQLYGSKSEKFDADQLELLFGPDAVKKPEAADCDQPGDGDAPAAENIVPLNKDRKRRRRKPRLPANLPVTEETVIPDEVKADPDAYRQIGQETSERLEVEPSRYSIHRIVRPTFVKKATHPGTFLTAPLPPCLLEGSILSPSLLAHIATAKYHDHLPLYRQQTILQYRNGIEITRGTLCNWMELAAHTLQPLYNIIAADIRQSDRLNIDETPVDYQAGAGQGCKQGYFWIYKSAQAGVLYDWHASREHTCLDTILAADKQLPFQGLIQCDGYKAYQAWANKNTGVMLAGCWTHARRKFIEAEPHSREARIIIGLIGQLYENDAKYRKWLVHNNHPPEAIVYYRRRYEKPLLDKIHRKLLELQPHYLPKSMMGKAVTYALNQWHKLCRAAKHSATLDNNGAENAVRPLKLGAKNWLFIGGEDTGWRSAVIYTMIENCRLLGKDPYAYLKWVFEKLPAMTNQDDLRQLLPAAWVKLSEEREYEKAAA